MQQLLDRLRLHSTPTKQPQPNRRRVFSKFVQDDDHSAPEFGKTINARFVLLQSSQFRRLSNLLGHTRRDHTQRGGDNHRLPLFLSTNLPPHLRIEVDDLEHARLNFGRRNRIAKWLEQHAASSKLAQDAKRSSTIGIFMLLRKEHIPATTHPGDMGVDDHIPK